MSEPAAPSKRRWWWIAGAIAAVVVLVAVAVTAISVADSSAATSVTLIPSSTPGANPFTSSVATTTPPAVDSVVKKSAELRTTLPTEKQTKTPIASGTTPGLYGGSGNVHVCDPQKLVSYLVANPHKAAAWARVLGIASTDIPSYVATLTPVILNSDTLVENHGYNKGAATSLLSVLQAGTAVMVDATGTPRVKCNCGNPLTPPKLISVANAHYIGPAWHGYAPDSVIAVQPGKKADSLSLVDVTTGTVFTQPTGGSAWVAASWASSDGTGIVRQTTIQTSTDGSQWTTTGTIPDALVTGLAWGEGLWVAVAEPTSALSPQSEIFTSTDLATWNEVASVPGRLQGVAFGDGSWVAVGMPSETYSDTFGISTVGAGLVYGSADGRQWHPVATIGDDIAKSQLDGFESIAYGGGKWIAVAGGISSPGVIPYESANGTDWTAQDATALATRSHPRIAQSPTTWLITASSGISQSEQEPTDGQIALSPDGSSWQLAPATGFSQALIESIGFGAGRWLATTEESYLPNPSHALVNSKVMASTDGTTWSEVGGIAGPMGAIAFGAAPIGSASPSPSPTTSADAAPASACTVQALQAVLTAAGRDGKVGEHDCMGVWAVAGVGLTDAEITQLYKWVDGAWTLQDRTVICAQNILPAELVGPVCQSN